MMRLSIEGHIRSIKITEGHLRDGGCEAEGEAEGDLGDGDAEDGHPLVLLLLRRLRFLYREKEQR